MKSKQIRIKMFEKIRGIGSIEFDCYANKRILIIKAECRVEIINQIRVKIDSPKYCIFTGRYTSFHI